MNATQSSAQVVTVIATVTVTRDELDQGWDGDIDEFAASIRATMHELVGDDGGAYVPGVVTYTREMTNRVHVKLSEDAGETAGDDTLREQMAGTLHTMGVHDHGDDDMYYCRSLAAALMPRVREHVAEVWEAYESWRETGRAAIDALNVIWRALEPDRKHMVFGDDPQRVVDETLRALREHRTDGGAAADEAEGVQ